MAIEGRSDAAAGGRIRLGMVGGGQGAFIGAVHRLAARMDDQYVFVAGALSADPKRARASGKELGLARDRIYSDYHEMAAAEAQREDGIEAVSIVTPNNVHVPAAMARWISAPSSRSSPPMIMTAGRCSNGNARSRTRSRERQKAHPSSPVI